MRRSKPTQRTTRMAWPLSTDEGPGLRRTNQALKAIVADMPPAEETIRPDLDSTNEEAQAETTPTGTTNSALFASCKGIGKKNVRNESKKTSPAEMPRAEHTGQESTSWRRTQKPNLSTLLVAQRTEWRMMTKNTDLKQPELILIESISQEPQPFPSKIWVFSKELDDSPHSSS
jgi:hypothetical protein